MLEMLVHLEIETLPPSFQLLKVGVPDGLDNALWPEGEDPRDAAATRAWGDAWLEAAATPLARVPSIVAPPGANWVLNPGHTAAAQERTEDSTPWPVERRSV